MHVVVTGAALLLLVLGAGLILGLATEDDGGVVALSEGPDSVGAAPSRGGTTAPNQSDGPSVASGPIDSRGYEERGRRGGKQRGDSKSARRPKVMLVVQLQDEAGAPGDGVSMGCGAGGRDAL